MSIIVRCGFVGADTATDVSSYVSVITDSDQFRALREQWIELVACSHRPSVFLSHEWFESAWQWRLRSARLNFLCYHSDGKLSGICPLVRWSQGGMRVLEFLTVPDTQLCDIVVRPEHQARAVEAFAAELERPRQRWDFLRLSRLPRDAIAAGLLAELGKRRFRVRCHEAAENPYVALDTKWETYYATRSRSVKKACNLAANRLMKAGNVVVHQLAAGSGSAADVERFVSNAIEVSARSWKMSTQNSLDHAGPQAFIRTLSQRAHERGWLSIWMVHLNDVPVAMEYQLVADNNVYALRSDFDNRHEHMSPGSYLSRYLLEQLFGRTLKRYMMGVGRNLYKYRWTEQAEPLLEGVAFNRTLKGTAHAVWALGLKPTLRRLRHRLRP